MAGLNLFTIIFLFYSPSQVTGEEYYIKANSTDLCTPPCLTLAQFITNVGHHFTPNVTLIFNPGRHYVNGGLILSNLSQFSMTSRDLTAQIICASFSQIIINHSQNIHITNLELVGCGGNQVVNVDNFMVHETTFKGQGNSGTALELIETTAQIINCTFLFNRQGVVIATHSNVKINQSNFENNGAHNHNVPVYRGSVLFADQQSNINITASTFINNSAQYRVLYSYECSITINTNNFIENIIISNDGVLLSSFSSIMIIEQSKFEDNIGRALSSDDSTVNVQMSEFSNNTVSFGDVLTFYSSNITIEQSSFEDIYNIGGTLFYFSSTVKIKASNFFRVGLVLYTSNTTIEHSAFEDSIVHNSDPNTLNSVFISHESSVTIRESRFNNNFGIILTFTGNRNSTIDKSEFRHNTGSVVLSSNSNVTITASVFDNNTEAEYFLLDQGIVLGSSGDSIVICDSNFTNNNSPVVVAFGSIIRHTKSLLVANNSVENGYAVIHLDNSEFIGHQSGNATISNNLRPLVAFTSNVTFMGNVTFSNNRQSIATTDLQEGGALTLVQSNAILDGTCSFEYNHAENGGAIFSIYSNLYMTGNVTIAHNTANRNGGGIYLTESDLECLNKSTFVLFNNTAKHKGGGLHAISSLIKAISVLQVTKVDTAILNFTNNIAEKGGGLSLEANAKLYVLKYEYGDIVFGSNVMYEQSFTIIFTANKADYGGAVYIDDDTNSGTCASDPRTECFFQVLAYIYGLYGLHSIPESTLHHTRNNLKPQSLYFSENNASISGSTLDGGLLDRCAVNQFAEVRIKYKEDYTDGGDGVTYLKHVSTVTDTSVSSQPVKICLCMDSEHNCTHKTHNIEVKKGETFTVSLASINEIDHPVNGLIHASLKFPGSAVASGQATREIPAECTNLTFNVISPNPSEQLTLYALDGPCRDVDLSKISLDINFLVCSCPIGLQTLGTSETNCSCECHEKIKQYAEECDSRTGAFLRRSPSNAWIAFTNNIKYSGYLVYPNCPFDYCNSLKISIDLNQPKGADAQCAFNRSSLMCGSCQPGLSISLGSSRCLSCPTYWPALFISISIAAILAGIALVILLLVLNMTVAVGTLNGLLFFANVIYANKSILLPFEESNFISVLISWLNLELGIDTCYFPGMDAFGKTWLQLAFPAYIILLVALVIIISSYFSRFSNLIGKKNPVATLATLILLSYVKLLETGFKSLSFGNLNYPDGSVKIVWLPDAMVKYLSGKHIILFFTAVLILLAGLVYTALLFSWQWLLHLPRWRIFKWTRDQKLQTFIETYHTPYVPKHRYWTGLLLIIRAILYLIVAVNVSNDPTVPLTAIIVVICCSFALKAFIGSRVYRNWPVDILETFFYLNILLFTTFTWYCLGECRNKKAAAYTSVLTMFIVLLLIIFYHVYTYLTVFSTVKKIKPGKMINKLFTASDPKPKPKSHWSPPPDDDIHQFNELLDVIDRPINTSDYKVPLKKEPVQKPTQSIVEMHKPQLAPPDPEANSQSDSEIRL